MCTNRHHPSTGDSFRIGDTEIILNAFLKTIVVLFLDRKTGVFRINRRKGPAGSAIRLSARFKLHGSEMTSRADQEVNLISSLLSKLSSCVKRFATNTKSPVSVNSADMRENYFGADKATSFWKRGSFRSGSNIGSSRSRAGVSGTPEASAASYGIESSFCKAAMARSGSPIRAATRARISIELGPTKPSLSIGLTAMARSARANAATLSPRLILVSARSPIRLKFSGCSLRRGSKSLWACRQLSWAAAWSPATSCAQPNQNRSSPLK